MFLTPVSMAVSVLLGIIAALNINLNAQITVMSFIFVLLIVVSIIKHEINIAIPVLIIGFAAGSFVASWTVSESNNTVLTYVGRYVTLEGVILSQGRESNTSDNYQYPLRVTAIDKNGEISEVNETVLLTSPVKINCGKSISAKGIIKDLPGIMNENGMDLEKYYRSQDIFTLWALAAMQAWRQASTILGPRAGVMPVKWNQAAPSKIRSQSNSSGFAS